VLIHHTLNLEYVHYSMPTSLSFIYTLQQDKIPHAYRIGNDANSHYYNFWQDADHVQGELEDSSKNTKHN
jgi:hypothetical protein